MNAIYLKESLIHIADKVDGTTSLEDVFKELSLIADIEESERQEEAGETLSHDEVKTMEKQWVK